MLYLKLFQNEQERQACTDTQEYVSYTVESNKVNIHKPFFCKLTLNNGEVIEIEGSGELTSEMTQQYSTTTVSAEIGDLCTSIGEYAFVDTNYYMGFESLTNITIGNSVTSIGTGAFDYCYGLTSVTIGNSVTSIGDNAFRYCSGLTSITIPDSVTSISDSVFDYCYGLTSITIPNSVTSICDDAFHECSGLTNVTIGSGVTSIGIRVFFNCTSLSNITSLATTAPTITNMTFDAMENNGTLYVPSGSSGYDAWLSALPSGWTKVEQ